MNESIYNSKSNSNGCLAFDVQEICGFPEMNYKPGPGYFKKCGDFDYEYIPLRCFMYKKKVEVIDLVSERENDNEYENESNSENENEIESDSDYKNKNDNENKNFVYKNKMEVIDLVCGK